MSGRTHDDHPMGYGLVRLERSLVVALDHGLVRLGLSSSRYGVLTFLDMEPGLTAAELARRAFVTPQSMMRLVAGLETAGLVARDHDDSDGRTLRVTLTASGATLLEEAHVWVGLVEEQLVADEQPRLLAQTARFLTRATARLDVMAGGTTQ